MKEKWLQVAAIAMAVALVFTIVTSNIVSITAISALKNAKNSGSKSVVADTTVPVTNADVSNGETQAVDPGSSNAATVSDTQTAGTTSSGGNNNSNTGTTKASGNTATTAKQGSANPLDTKEKVFDFYKTAIGKIKSQGTAGHTRKEWQTIDALDLPGGAIVKPIIESFVKGEDKAEESVSAKGSKEAKDRMAPCGAPISKIKSAVCVPSGNNYKITIVMIDEVNPAKGSNGVAAMATGILYMEDVKSTVANDATVSRVVKSLNEDSKITYKAYTITATMTKDGKFITLDHVVSGDIVAGAKLVVGSISGTGTLTFHSSWYDFKY